MTRLSPARFDLALAAAVLVLTLAELLAASAARPVLHAAAGTVAAAGFLARGRDARVPLLTVGVAFSAVAAGGEDPRTGLVLALGLALATAATRCPLRPALLSTGSLVAVVAAGEAVRSGDLQRTPFIVLALGLPPFVAGRLLRGRSERQRRLEEIHRALELEQARSQRLAAEVERARMAREVHDGLSNGLGLIVLQAAAAIRLVGRDREGLRETLDIMEEAARRTLDELGSLGAAGSDGPGLAEIEALLTDVRAAGIDARLRLDGEMLGLDAGLQLAVHRIVQEALTNTAKHAGARRVDVRILRSGRHLEVSVVDDGAGAADPDETGSGRGVPGMRERVRAYGGRLHAAPRPEGGFTVRAELPLATEVAA